MDGEPNNLLLTPFPYDIKGFLQRTDGHLECVRRVSVVTNGVPRDNGNNEKGTFKKFAIYFLKDGLDRPPSPQVQGIERGKN